MAEAVKHHYRFQPGLTLRHTFILSDNLLFSLPDYRCVNWAKTLNIHLSYVKKKKKKNQNLVEMKNMTRRAIELHAENGTCLDLSLYFTCASSRVWDQDARIVPWESN